MRQVQTTQLISPQRFLRRRKKSLFPPSPVLRSSSKRDEAGLQGGLRGRRLGHCQEPSEAGGGGQVGEGEGEEADPRDERATGRGRPTRSHCHGKHCDTSRLVWLKSS